MINPSRCQFVEQFIHSIDSGCSSLRRNELNTAGFANTVQHCRSQKKTAAGQNPFPFCANLARPPHVSDEGEL
jgi:hypothetical protein